MRLRSRSLFVVLLGAAAGSFAQTPVPIRFGDSEAAVFDDIKEIETFHTNAIHGRSGGPQSPPARKSDTSGSIANAIGKNSTIGKAASELSSIKSAGSTSAAIGGAINSAFGFADLLGDASAASSLLDQLTDGTLEPDVDGYTRGSPDTPTSLCSGRETGSAECEKCFESAAENLTAARYDLEKLRVAGLSTKNYVTTKLAVGDGLSGVTGLAALEWQRQRSGINKQFDKFKITYDGKYEEFMKGLQRAMARFDSCESQYGVRDWYNRFGFLYVQFMADKYKRNF